MSRKILFACLLVIFMLAISSAWAQGNSQGVGQVGHADLPHLDTWGVPHLDEAIQNAERNHHQNGGPGVTLERLRDFHNHLMDVLGMPAHTKVDMPQLESMRVSLQFMFPQIMGGVSQKPGEPQGEMTHKLSTAGAVSRKPEGEMTHTLSPFAAAFLEQHMITQKRWNVAYQFAPGEWTVQKGIDADKHYQHLEDMDNPVKPGKARVSRHLSPQTQEINTRLRSVIHLENSDVAKLLLDAKETFNLSAVDVAKIAAATVGK